MTNDAKYLFKRAEAELKMAQNSREPTAAKAHYILAGHYLDRAFGEEHHQTPAVSDGAGAHDPSTSDRR